MLVWLCDDIQLTQFALKERVAPIGAADAAGAGADSKYGGGNRRAVNEDDSEMDSFVMFDIMAKSYAAVAAGKADPAECDASLQREFGTTDQPPANRPAARCDPVRLQS
jgi:hypothetical protein